MKTRVGNPDKNDGKILVQYVRTRTPIEAFRMLQAGSPIDQAAGYYAGAGVLDKDFYMMDKLEKFHKIAELKMREQVARQEIAAIQQQYNESLKQQQDDAEKAKADSEAAQTPPAGPTN